jgi:hypothetical protein
MMASSGGGVAESKASSVLIEEVVASGAGGSDAAVVEGADGAFSFKASSIVPSSMTDRDRQQLFLKWCVGVSVFAGNARC